MNIINAPLPDLPDPPALQAWFLEQPLIPAAALLVAAIAMLVATNRAGKIKVGAPIAGVLLLLGVGAYLLGERVRTDREAMMEGTRALIMAAVTGEGEVAEDLLAPDATLAADGRIEEGVDKALLVRAIEGAGRWIQDGSQGIFQLDAAVDGPNVGRSQFVVRVSGEGTPPTFSAWRFDWRRDSDGAWRVRLLDVLRINGRAPRGTVSRWVRQRAM